MKSTFLFCLLILFYAQFCSAKLGPPFLTDDPQPVDFRHWEYYISSISQYNSDAWSGTSPHFEVNYGLIHRVQIHLLLPMNYSIIHHQGVRFGYADTELGVKYCFIQETEKRPQIGTFPIVIIPTVSNAKFSDGKPQVFIPIWLQKTWNKFTTYGGAGYWIESGLNSKNSIFSGWEIQYDFSTVVTLGGELYYHSADSIDAKSVTAFNIGGSFNASKKTHFIFSLGHSITNDRFFSSYVGLLWTI